MPDDLTKRGANAQEAFERVLNAKAKAENAWAALHPNRPAYNLGDVRDYLHEVLDQTNQAIEAIERDPDG